MAKNKAAAMTPAAPPPDNLDVHDLWTEFVRRYRSVRLSRESASRVLNEFVHQTDVDAEEMVLNGIEADGWLDVFREHLDGALDTAANRPEPEPLPRGKDAGELVALYQTLSGEPGDCGPVFEFLDQRPDSGLGLLTKMIDKEGLTAKFRSFLNKRLAKAG